MHQQDLNHEYFCHYDVVYCMNGHQRGVFLCSLNDGTNFNKHFLFSCYYFTKGVRKAHYGASPPKTLKTFKRLRGQNVSYLTVERSLNESVPNLAVVITPLCPTF